MIWSSLMDLYYLFPFTCFTLNLQIKTDTAFPLAHSSDARDSTRLWDHFLTAGTTVQSHETSRSFIVDEMVMQQISIQVLQLSLPNHHSTIPPHSSPWPSSTLSYILVLSGAIRKNSGCHRKGRNRPEPIRAHERFSEIESRHYLANDVMPILLWSRKPPQVTN